MASWDDKLRTATEEGNIKEVELCVKNRANLECELRGQTALYHAAENGHIDVTKWLIDQGCSPWVKSLEGRTPYDLVNIESYDDEEEKRQEVMDFLKTVMSKTSPEVTPDTHLQEPAAQVVEACKFGDPHPSLSCGMVVGSNKCPAGYSCLGGPGDEYFACCPDENKPTPDKCPRVTYPKSRCYVRRSCRNDSSCRGNKKCCKQGCQYKCVAPVY